MKIKNSNLRIMKAAGMVVLFLLFCVFVYAGDDERYGTLTKIEGTTEVRIQKQAWEAGREGMVLHAGDEIRTGKDSRAELWLDDNGKTGLVEIRPETRMSLNKLELMPGGDKETLLDVAVGRVLVRAGKLAGESKFEVRTPSSTAGVRGTVFEMAVEERKQ